MFRRYRLVALVVALLVVFVAGVSSVTFRIYDERQARVSSIARLSAENRRLIELHDRESCRTDHLVAEAVRTQARTLVAAAQTQPAQQTPEARARAAAYLAQVERDAAAIDCKEPQ